MICASARRAASNHPVTAGNTPPRRRPTRDAHVPVFHPALATHDAGRGRDARVGTSPVTRSMASAKKAGTSFERDIADYLAEHVDDRIDRRPKTGAKDKGDIAGLRHMGQRVVIECKNTSRLALAGWAAEAEVERGNDDALAGLIAHKRHGKGKAQDQWITMTVGELVALLNGDRSHLE